jgi:dynactin complex subunit
MAGQDMELRVGHAIMTNDGRRGTVKFVGDVWELPGDEYGAVRTFVGVEFNRPTGQNDGSIDGKRYFDGRPDHCSFMRPAKILIVKTASGQDLSTNVRRKKRGYQKNKAPARETMTEFQKQKKKQSEETRKERHRGTKGRAIGGATGGKGPRNWATFATGKSQGGANESETIGAGRQSRIGRPRR